jgi:hypothetical protein
MKHLFKQVHLAEDRFMNQQIDTELFLSSVLLNSYLRYKYPAHYYLIFIKFLFEFYRNALKDGKDSWNPLMVYMTLVPLKYGDMVPLEELEKIKKLYISI